MCRIEIGRAQHDAPRDAVDLDQRNCRGELVAHPEKDRPMPKLVQPAAKRGADSEIGESDLAVAGPEGTLCLETGSA